MGISGKYPRRRLPPYGRLLKERLSRPMEWRRYSGTSADGFHVALWVVTGTGAWAWAEYHRDSRLFLLSPPDTDPAKFDWRLLAGHPPALLLPLGESERGMVDRLAVAMIRDGVERISLMCSGGVYYRAGQRVAA